MQELETQSREVSAIDTESMSLITRGEIDMQIATAHKYPRSIKRFRDEALSMVTLNEVIASECFYALLRKSFNKETRKYEDVVIEGPSARFAEVIASAWGNCRAGARIVQESPTFIVSQGVFHDLERNVAIAYEVQRPIVGSSGQRFKADMIGVTGNAASSIALRNAILKGVPKAFWMDLYQAARRCAVGDFKSLSNRRIEAMKEFAALGVSRERVLAHLGLAGIEDISQEHLLLLRGMLTALREGDSTPDQMFAMAGDDRAGTTSSVPRKSAEVPRQQPDGEVIATAQAAPESDDVRNDTYAGASPANVGTPAFDGLVKDDVPPKPTREIGEDNGEPASDGERQHLLMRARAARADLMLLLEEFGLTRLDPGTLDGLTKAQFKAIKAAI